MNTNINKISYDSVIKLDIIPEVFDVSGNFTILDVNEFNNILSSTSVITTENLMHVYLYVKSYMFAKKSNENKYSTSSKGVGSFYKEVSIISDDIGLSNKTVISCLDELVNLNLLIKHETGSCIKKKRGKECVENVPNIYVLNNENASKEIDLTIHKLKNYYGVDDFNPYIGKDKIKNKNNIWDT